MRTLGTFALAAVALGFALTSVYLYWQLEAARSQPRVAQESTCLLQPSAAVAQPASPVTAPTELAPATPRETSLSAATSSSPTGSPALAITDEQREYFTRKRYSPLFRELELSEDDIAALVPLLNEQDQRASKPIPKSRVAADGTILPDPDGPRQSASDQAELAALIGPDKAAKLMESRKTLSARAQMHALRLRLDDSSEPISDQQMQQLLTATKNRDYNSVPLRVEGDPPDAFSKRFQTWRSTLDRQVREDAAAVLTPGQLKTLDEDMAAQARMRSTLTVNLKQPAAGAAAP